MKDFNEIFKAIEDSLANMDVKVNEKLAALYDKIDEYRDVFKKNVSRNDKENKADGGAEKKKKSNDKFAEMAPYLDEESLHELTVEFCESDLETDMAEILPFLDEDDIALIMEKFRDAEEFKGLHVEDLLPFANEEYIDKLFLDKFMNGVTDDSLLSFVSDNGWHELVVRYSESEDSNLNMDDIYPFLNDDDLKLLFRTYLKRRKK